MWPRGQIDISLGDLLFGVLSACRPERKDTSELLRQVWGTDAVIPCLSVRSAFDHLLQAIEPSTRNEIAFSPVTVPAMSIIAASARYLAVPIPSSSETMFPTVEACRNAMTANTRMLVLAPLFGARIDLSAYRQLADEHGVLLIEDCAQAFDGVFRGDPEAHVSLFSFGPIKRFTAGGGAIAVVRDRALRSRIADIQAGLPRQHQLRFLWRLLKLATFRLLSTRMLYSIWFQMLAGLGMSVDQFVSDQLKSYKESSLLDQIRHRPCDAQINLILRRVQRADDRRIDRHARRMKSFVEGLPAGVSPLGTDHQTHTFWMCPVRADDPEALVRLMHRNSFDATVTHRLSEILLPESGAASKQSPNGQLLENVVFLPAYPEMPDRELERMRVVLNRWSTSHAVSGCAGDNELL